MVAVLLRCCACRKLAWLVDRPGAQWLERFTGMYEKLVWLNPTPQETWEYSTSVTMTQDLVDGNMFPLTIKGLEEGMGRLSK